MKRVRGQQGSALILIIGIIAALAILAVAIVVLTGNVQRNTAGHRTQSKTFNVAEAGLDAGAATLRSTWSQTTDVTVNPAVLTAQLEASAGSAELPASDVKVVFYDDDARPGQPPSLSPKMDQRYSYDANKNGYLWVVSTAKVSGKTTRVQALFRRGMFSGLLMDGVALYTKNLLTIAGNGAPIGSDDGGKTSAYVESITTDPKKLEADIRASVNLYQPTSSTGVGIDDVFPSSTLNALTAAARTAGTYCKDERDLTNKASDKMFWTKDPRVIVVESGNLSDLPTGIWTAENPGVVILLNGSLTVKGNSAIYGVIYLPAGGVTYKGTPEIHGMVIANGTCDLRGDRAISSNATVIANINKKSTSTVQLVPNTWREVKP